VLLVHYREGHVMVMCHIEEDRRENGEYRGRVDWPRASSKENEIDGAYMALQSRPIGFGFAGVR
jgi:hypothetical protein